MRRSLLPGLGYALMALCPVGIARGHVVSHVVGDLKVGGKAWSLEMQLDVGLAFPELRQDPDLPPPEWAWFEQLPESELQRAELGARDFLRRRFAMVTDDGGELDYEVEFPRSPVSLDLASPAIAVRLSGDLPEDGGELFVHWRNGREDIVEPALYLVMDKEESSPPLILPVAPDGMQFITRVGNSPAGHSVESIDRNPVVAFFIWMREGVLHVVPGGLDHMAFIFGMFLAGGGWRILLAQSLVFTLAHSVTLMAATWGVVNAPPGIVEPLIALSIAWIAAENLWQAEGKVGRVRLFVVFCFGLVHGLGFAGALSELTGENRVPLTELVGFNLGVELGQVIVLAVAMLVFALVERYYSEHRNAIARVCSMFITGTGIIWFLDRLDVI